MLRVTLRKVWIAEGVVQSSLSPSGATFRVAAVLELRHADYAPPFACAAQCGERAMGTLGT